MARHDAHRLTGEWFERHPDILAEIERLKTTPKGINDMGDRRKTLQATKEPTE